MHFRLSTGEVGCFAVELGAREDLSFGIERERLVIEGGDATIPGAAYTVEADGSLSTWSGIKLPAELTPQRSTNLLFLTTLSGFPEVRPAYDLFASMAFYSALRQD
jgi:hypothetical protein